MDGLGWLERFSRSSGRLRIEVQRATTEALQHLTWAGGEAAMFGPLDDGGYVIYFHSPAPSASAVLEEFAHVLQDRRRRFTEHSIQEMALRREIEVHECLEAHADEWNLPEPERQQTRQLLRQDREKLDRLKSWR